MFRLGICLGTRAGGAAIAVGGASAVMLSLQPTDRTAEAHAATKPTPPGVLMMGTGEYTTGYVGGKGADSDKSQGVVGLVCLDLMQKVRGVCHCDGLP